MPWSARRGDDSALAYTLGRRRRYPRFRRQLCPMARNYICVSQVGIGVRLESRFCDVRWLQELAPYTNLPLVAGERAERMRSRARHRLGGRAGPGTYLTPPNSVDRPPTQ